MARYAVVQIVDKCLRCRGCMVACERVNKLEASGNADTVTYEDLVAVKSQYAAPLRDMGPYVRYNCWHCPSAPCGPACPWGAIYENSDSNGDVRGMDIDRSYCHPLASDATYAARTGGNSKGTCTYQCRTDCLRGGYPRFGVNSLVDSSTKVYKCTLCASKIIAGDLSEPACVTACPNKALRYGILSGNNVLDTTRGTLNTASYPYRATFGGGFAWVSNKVFISPTADPYIEDHLTPMISRFLLSPAGWSFIMPAAIVGGLYGVIKRRMSLQNA